MKIDKIGQNYSLFVREMWHVIRQRIVSINLNFNKNLTTRGRKNSISLFLSFLTTLGKINEKFGSLFKGNSTYCPFSFVVTIFDFKFGPYVISRLIWLFNSDKNFATFGGKDSYLASWLWRGIIGPNLLPFWHPLATFDVSRLIEQKKKEFFTRSSILCHFWRKKNFWRPLLRFFFLRDESTLAGWRPPWGPLWQDGFLLTRWGPPRLGSAILTPYASFGNTFGLWHWTDCNIYWRALFYAAIHCAGKTLNPLSRNRTHQNTINKMHRKSTEILSNTFKFQVSSQALLQMLMPPVYIPWMPMPKISTKQIVKNKMLPTKKCIC